MRRGRAHHGKLSFGWSFFIWASQREACYTKSEKNSRVTLILEIEETSTLERMQKNDGFLGFFLFGILLFMVLISATRNFRKRTKSNMLRHSNNVGNKMLKILQDKNIKFENLMKMEDTWNSLL